MSEKSTMQLLSDTGLNAFAAKLLADSYDKINLRLKEALPDQLCFRLGNCIITLREAEDDKTVGRL